MVNRGFRYALENDLTAKGSLVKFGHYLAKEYHVNGAHAQTAMGVALSLAKGHRRRLSKGKKSKVPYVFRPFLRADDFTSLLKRACSSFAPIWRMDQLLCQTLNLPS